MELFRFNTFFFPLIFRCAPFLTRRTPLQWHLQPHPTSNLRTCRDDKHPRGKKNLPRRVKINRLLLRLSQAIRLEIRPLLINRSSGTPPRGRSRSIRIPLRFQIWAPRRGPRKLQTRTRDSEKAYNEMYSPEPLIYGKSLGIFSLFVFCQLLIQ
jgi:hypothetical protein